MKSEWQADKQQMETEYRLNGDQMKSEWRANGEKMVMFVCLLQGYDQTFVTCLTNRITICKVP